jgi:hypothetical protein
MSVRPGCHRDLRSTAKGAVAYTNSAMPVPRTISVASVLPRGLRELLQQAPQSFQIESPNAW